MYIWKPFQYNNVFEDFYATCDEDTQGAIDHRLDRLIDRGNLAREPISKPLGDGIFELRAKSARLLYYFGFNREIIFVHALHKKRYDVPKRDIDLAKKYRDLIESNLESYDEITIFN
ncbi:MAG: type II toxin-antitoxin system RelE/ParE family toxin [Nitrospiria bacterium]